MDKLREIDWRGLAKTATQKVKKYTLNLTDLEIKVEDATNSETWGEPASQPASQPGGLPAGRPLWLLWVTLPACLPGRKGPIRWEWGGPDPTAAGVCPALLQAPTAAP